MFPDDYKASVKCVTVLFDLMRNIGDNEASFELYSCWIDEEQKDKNEELTQTISLSAFRLSDNFELKDRQYFFIVK